MNLMAYNPCPVAYVKYRDTRAAIPTFDELIEPTEQLALSTVGAD
jgi:hypothetical protein